MFTSFSDLQKGRGAFDDLQKEVERLAKGGFEKDDDGSYWQPTVDKPGNGFALIRFLAPPKGEPTPFVRFWSHGFKGPTNKWYIELSRTTLNQPDPVSELNTELWNSGIESNKEIARAQKRKLYYVSNILVIKDPKNPENEGQVFRFKYGKKIFDKIKNVMKPEDDGSGTEPMNPFDLWVGANFNLKIRKADGYRNYDDSFFEKQTSQVAKTDEEIEIIWNKEYPLAPLVDPSLFKSYEDLKTRLDAVLNSKWKSVNKPNDAVKSEEAAEPASEEAPKPKAKAAKPAKEEVAEEESEEGIDYFANLAKNAVKA